jgi:uncharacterized protein (TIGR03067 family)
MRILARLSALLLATSFLSLGACGDDSPGGADAAPAIDGAVTTPDAADTTPDAADTTPDAADTTPDAADTTPDAAQQAGAALNGTYTLTTIDGEPPDGSDPVQTWTFTDGAFQIQAEGAEIDGTYTYDDSTDPKEVDLEVKGDAVLGIYQFNEDSSVLTIKANDDGTTRPTNFDIEKNADVVEFTRQ